MTPKPFEKFRAVSEREEADLRLIQIAASPNETHIEKETKNGIENEEKWDIVWLNVCKFALLHIVFVYAVYLALTFRISWKTLVFSYIYVMFGVFGVTAGSHRLWSHRSYTANLPLRIFLMLMQSSTIENSIYVWVRDHRAHHKFTDTNADPHNATRGLFFSHIGWLIVKKHKDVMEKGKTIDLSDLLADPVVRFQTKYYGILTILWCFVIPTLIPWYFRNENLWIAYIMSIAKYTYTLNITFSVNSFAHMFGMKPFDKSIMPSENKLVAFFAFGEGWHNYHHVFPWDYKTAELGNYRLNFTTCFIDLMAKIGWATDLKSASKEIIKKRIVRTGDGTHPNIDDLVKEIYEDKKLDICPEYESETIWGWGDQDMNDEEKKAINLLNGHSH